MGVIDLDRAFGRRYPARVVYDVVPALTTRGYFFMISTSDLGEEDGRKRIIRSLTLNFEGTFPPRG